MVPRAPVGLVIPGRDNTEKCWHLCNVCTTCVPPYLQSHPNLVHVSSIDSLFRMLAKGRVDLILAEYRNGMSIIEKTPIVEGHRFGVLPVDYQITDVYIVLSKARTDSQHLAAELSRIAEKVLVSSEAKTLREKHHIFELPETESLAR